jgi:hypothetical protein
MTFFGLNNLQELWLEGNICLDKNFDNPSLETIQDELFKTCGSAYTLYELKNLVKNSREETDKKIEKLATRFDELEKKLDEHNEENAKKIEETKKIGEAIYEILLQNRRTRMW